jgi:hypothetical protein
MLTSPVEDALLKIQQMNLEELRSQWQKAYSIAPPRRASRDFLIMSLAYHVQSKLLGGLSRETRRRLRMTEKTGTAAPRLKEGAQLVREWDGRTCCVTVTADGFLYEGEVYRSLSSVAHAITGTKWSGPAFFGLRQEKR